MRSKRTALLVVLTAVAVIVGMSLPALGGGRPLTAELSGDNEVPPSGSEATGTAHFTLNQGTGEVCLEVTSSGYEEGEVILAGHIHPGEAGVNNPPIIDFGVNAPNFSNCVDADPDLIKDIRQNPENYYFNLHSNVTPSGVIRGQLTK